MSRQNNNENARLKIVSRQDDRDLPDLGVTTLDELLHHSAARNPGAVALSAMGADVSYADLQELSAAVASWLLAQGLKANERVAVALPNLLAHPIACLGIIRA
ncbi:AMP-binding protein, partial [Pseudomonas aeruginosa]